MSTPSNTMTMGPERVEPAAIPWTRLLYWSLRRELWENRSIYIAPLAVGGVLLFGFLISTIFLPGKMRAMSALDPALQHKELAQPYFLAAGVMMLTTLAIGVFYSLDALYGERRDRSVLFWKSLPVSDLTTVVAKALTAVLVLPLVTFAVTMGTQWIMLLLSTAVLLASGMSVALLWSHASLFQSWIVLLHHLVVVHGLWYAPIYGWLLLVSVWARRAPFLWATLPLLAVGIVEKLTFNTTHFGMLLANRMAGGGGPDNFVSGYLSMDPLMHFSAADSLFSPGLWIGLAVMAAFLAAAVRLRRYQGPI